MVTSYELSEIVLQRAKSHDPFCVLGGDPIKWRMWAAGMGAKYTRAEEHPNKDLQVLIQLFPIPLQQKNKVLLFP